MYVMERMESADASLVSNKLPFGFADRNETSLSIHEVFTSHPRMTDTFQHSHVTLVFIWSWLRGGKQQWPCLADLYSQTPQHSSSFSLFMKDVRHKATHEKRRYRTKRQKTNHGDGQDRRKWKRSRCREAQRFLGLKKWSECRLSVLQTRLDGFSVMWLTWPLHCPICLPGEAVGLLFAVRFGSLLIIINHYNQYSASSQQISFATLGWSWAET